MPKEGGLGDQLYVDGYDLSGSIGSIQNISGALGVLTVTDITQSAPERLAGLADGAIGFSSWFNPDTGAAHDVLSALPTIDVGASYFHQQVLGNPAASLFAKQIGYDPNRGADGSLAMGTALTANGYGLEWGRQHTAGKRTDTAAANGTGFDSGYAGTGYLHLPGTSGNYASTPDAAALDIVGDMELIARIAPTDWSPAADGYIISKFLTTGNQRSYSLALLTTGALQFQFSADGTTAVTKSSTANLSALAANAVKWVRATMDVDNGAAGYDVKFYTSDDGSTWTQLGTTVTTATATSIFASTAVLELGSQNGGTSGHFVGKILEAKVLTGLAGSEVAHPVATISGITDATGKTWTVNGTAFLSAMNLYGLQMYVHLFGFTGTSITVKLQESGDNGSADAWTDVAGATTAALTAIGAVRIATSAALTVKRYLRVVSVGTFSSAVFAVNVVRNLSVEAP